VSSVLLPNPTYKAARKPIPSGGARRVATVKRLVAPTNVDTMALFYGMRDFQTDPMRHIAEALIPRSVDHKPGRSQR
jgi:hypothetical protein